MCRLRMQLVISLENGVLNNFVIQYKRDTLNRMKFLSDKRWQFYTKRLVQSSTNASTLKSLHSNHHNYSY
uniref:Aspartate-semialdehyde dehydrogenase n=1 Tax=Rhizophora mucronata TaxID=61149 RepID=A0A2P2LQI1_RHIMU